MTARYHICLTDDERTFLKTFTASERVNAKNYARARALLLLDRASGVGPAWSLEQTETAVGLTQRTLINLKEKFAHQGLESLFGPRKTERVGRPCKIDGKLQARIIELACEQPPKGHARWTVRLLQQNLKDKGIVDEISVMSVQRVLKKTNLNLTDQPTGKFLRGKVESS